MQLDITHPHLLEDYLKSKNWLNDHEQVLILESTDEDDLNNTFRVRTHDRTFMVKQARPSEDSHLQLVAPVSRVAMEGRFYEKIRPFSSINERMPQLLGTDTAAGILVLEDLGTTGDYTYLYQPGQTLTLTEAEALAHYMAMLHRLTWQETIDETFANREIRAFNHEHIFIYPFMEDNGFDLDSTTKGLQSISMAYKVDGRLKQKIKETGLVYLADGRCLLHGNFYPGNWRKTFAGIRVVAPECCFYGAPEFDLGVMTAHLMMATQSEDTIRKVYQTYGEIKNPSLVDRFTGIEIMRRLIGSAQLPLSLSLLDKEELLETAYELIMNH